MRGNGPRRRTQIMPGLHIVRKPLKGVDRFYIYAWRGGPCIYRQDGSYPIITPQILALQLKEMSNERRKADGIPFQTVIDAYRQSPEFIQRADTTQTDYKLWIRRVEDQFGDTPISVLEDRRIRADFIAWRDTWAANPRSADRAIGMLSRILNFAYDRSIISDNHAANIRNLHHVNNADEIWEEHHWKIWNQTDIPQQLEDVIIVASLTGLRRTDLTRLRWEEHVFPTAIKIQTKKKNVRAVIPILPELRDWMNLQTNKSGAVLKNSRGFTWSPSGLASTFQKKRPEGLDRTLHDLRGTFATRLIMAGFTDDQAAMVMGWSSKRISEIRARYVDEERVILNLAAKLSA